MFNDDPLTIDIKEGKTPGTRVVHLTGPITLTNLFSFQAELRNGELPKRSILDLTGVPYVDSAGMGVIVNYYTHCKNKGSEMIVAGVNKRVMELFKLTHVDQIIPMKSTTEEAEG